MSVERVLIVDDDAEARTALAEAVRRAGHEVVEAGDGLEALERLQETEPDLVFTDMRMPRLDGVALLVQARAMGVRARFIVLTALADVQVAVEAMRAGAEDFLVKPLAPEKVLAQVDKLRERRQLELPGVEDHLRTGEPELGQIIGDSAELGSVLDVVRMSAGTNATVLILGESGTGKELFAQALHDLSSRSGKALIKLNCAALPDALLESELFGHERGAFTGAVARKYGRFERAHGGTLFLDEVGEIPHSMQVKLLRVLQQREFERVGGVETLRADVRLVAATNKDLQREVAAGRFREDLFYRLNVVTLTVPPLRQRKGDIQALVAHFLRQFSQAYRKRITGIAPAALDVLLLHDWPGNVRELENAIERAVVMCKGAKLRVEDLPASIQTLRHLGGLEGPLVPGATLYDIERYAILRTLEAVGGSTSRAAAVLGVSARKIQYRLKEYASAEAPARRRPKGDDEGPPGAA
jgi:two-component system NtrC family response regulator/two-component system response regulator HydG